MNRFFALFGTIVLIFLLAFPTSDLFGRGGGRGGGGGGRGGGGRGSFQGSRSSFNRGSSFDRSPSMSRATSSTGTFRTRGDAMPGRDSFARQNIPAARRDIPAARRDIPTARSNISNIRGNISNPTRSDVQNFLNSSERSPPQRLSQFQDAGARLNERQNLGNNIRNEVSENHRDYGNWFNNNFWNQHNYRPPYYNNRSNWWKWTTAAGISSWLGWTSTPLYYDSFDSGYSSYYGSSETETQGSTYNQPQETAPAQTTPIATTPSSISGDDWMPLGVFALSKQGNDIVTPNFYLQMALKKDGTLAGTFYNSTTKATHGVEGAIDKNSQVAAWKIADNSNSPVFETGIYNLTRSEAPAQVHYSDGRKEVIDLIRLEENK